MVYRPFSPMKGQMEKPIHSGRKEEENLDFCGRYTSPSLCLYLPDILGSSPSPTIIVIFFLRSFRCRMKIICSNVDSAKKIHQAASSSVDARILLSRFADSIIYASPARRPRRRIAAFLLFGLTLLCTPRRHYGHFLSLLHHDALRVPYIRSDDR